MSTELKIRRIGGSFMLHLTADVARAMAPMPDNPSSQPRTAIGGFWTRAPRPGAARPTRNCWRNAT